MSFLRSTGAALAALLVALFLLPTDVSADAAPVRVLFVGDSLTEQLHGMDRLRTELDAAGFQYQLFNGGVGGMGTPGLVQAVTGMIRATQPDLVVVGIGTNDDLSAFQEGYYIGQPLIGGPKHDPLDFEGRFRALLATVRQASSTVKMLVAINQCPMAPPAPTWINMPTKNNVIYRSAYDMAAGRLTPQVVGFVSLDRIPSSYMNTTDGFHPGPAGQDKQQDQYYRALTPLYGLPAIPDDPALTASCT